VIVCSLSDFQAELRLPSILKKLYRLDDNKKN
jgi:hypothetical protein